MEGLMVFIICGVYMLIGLLLLAEYVFSSIALQRIAKRRDIKRRVLVWLPFGFDWILGNIVDAHEVKTTGRDRKWRKILLVTNVINFVLLIILYCVMLFIMIYEMSYSGYPYAMASLTVALIPYIIFLLCYVLANTVLVTLRIICYYNIYNSTVPVKTVLYLVLTLIVPLGKCICLSKCVKYSQLEFENTIN